MIAPSVNAPATGAMASLRAATASRHARLERASGLPGSLVTTDDLIATLLRLHGFHAAVEASAPPVAFWERLGLPHAATVRSTWLANDLARLGLRAEDLAARPPCSGLAPLANDAERLGRAYVIEGSALGGRVLHAHVTRHALAPAPLAFLGAHGADTGRLWRRFGTTLERHVVDERDVASAVAAANATFDVLIRWFSAEATATAGDPGARAGGTRSGAS